MKKTVLISIVLSIFSSCKIIHSLTELNKTNAKIYSYKTGNKEIRFIPMHHLGKKEFYDNVKKLVTDHKNKGYVVYYELISTDFTKDSLLKDSIRRKVRKLKGFSGSYKDNANGSYFKKYIQQPTYTSLGTDSTDLRADVNYLQLINQWEKANGTIMLDSADLKTSFNEKFNKSTFYTKKQYKKIFIQYRNDYLIHLIKTSHDKKILIIYGAGHRKDLKKRINK